MLISKGYLLGFKFRPMGIMHTIVLCELTMWYVITSEVDGHERT